MFLGLEVGGGGPVADWLPSGVVALGLVGVVGAALFTRWPAWARTPRTPAPIDLVLFVFLAAPLLWLVSEMDGSR